MPLTKVNNNSIDPNAVTTDKIAPGTINLSDIAPGVFGSLAFQETSNIAITGGNVSGISSLSVSGSATVLGNVSITGNINTSGNITSSGSIFSSRDAFISGNVSVGKGFFETANIQGTGVGASVVMDPANSGVLYFTGSATINTTVDIKGVANLATGTSTTLVLLMTNGVTPYRVTGVTVEGSSATVKWFGGAAPASGSASNIDVYTFNVIKTGASAYTVFSSQARFG